MDEAGAWGARGPRGARGAPGVKATVGQSIRVLEAVEDGQSPTKFLAAYKRVFLTSSYLQNT